MNISSKVVMLTYLRHKYCYLSQNFIVNIQEKINKKMLEAMILIGNIRFSRHQHTFDIILPITL